MTDSELPPLPTGAQRRLPEADYTLPGTLAFVTIRARHGTAPFTDERLAKQVIDGLMWMREHRDVKIYAYCLMPDHLHALLQLGEEGVELGQIIGAFKSFTTKQSWKLRYRGQLWQDRFYDHLVRKSEDARSIVEYILQNPVRKGLVEEAGLYAYSGMPDEME